MSFSKKISSTELTKSNYENEVKFSQVVKDGRHILEMEVTYQTKEWAWAGDLDDTGIFIFSYLLYDYKKKILSLRRLKESVYTLNLLRQKMIPSQEKTGITLLEEFQVLFTLYEKLKKEEMSWEDCEEYIMKQISAYHSAK